MKNSTLYFFVCCFCSGIVFRFFVDIGIIFPLFVTALVFLLSLSSNGRESKGKNSLLVFLLVFGFFLGVLRFDLVGQNSSSSIKGFVEKNVLMEGVIVEEPDERENNTKLVVSLEKIFWEGDVLNIKTKSIVTVDLYPQWNYGDRISLEGVLQVPENFTSDLGREFNYVGYLTKDGIYYQMFRPKIILVGHDEGNFIKAKLFGWKKGFLENISQVIHEPYSALLGGLTVGAKQSLGEKLLDDFRTAGLIHIVVLSGYNVTIIIIALMWIFSFLPKKITAVLGIISVALFAMMTGAGATIVRASVMALLIIVARTVGRKIDILRLLFITGFLMVFQNPYILMFDPSFQLSFMAMLGLLLLAPIFESYLKFIPEKFGLREIAAATIATQIFVLPLLLYMMGKISLVAIVVNLLVLIFIPVTMFLGFVTGVLGFVSYTLSMIFALPTFAFLYYEIAVVEFFARLPFASIAVPSFSFSLMIGVYILYGIILFRKYKPQRFLLSEIKEGDKKINS